MINRSGSVSILGCMMLIDGLISETQIGREWNSLSIMMGHFTLGTLRIGFLEFSVHFNTTSRLLNSNTSDSDVPHVILNYVFTHSVETAMFK